jgi:ATP-dependent exoDNAse (exonuclease V) beta subunit
VWPALEARVKGLTVIGASAGSGKTHRLSEEVVAALDPSSPGALLAESLIAVTFTRRADAELQSRVRRALLTRAHVEVAQSLPLAFMGTTHAVAHRLVDAFAIEAGVAPGATILPDGEALLRSALDGALDPSLREEIDSVARRLSMTGYFGEAPWLEMVRAILRLARENRIEPAELAIMPRASIDGLRALRPAELSDAFALDRAFDEALERAERELSALLAVPPRRGAKGMAAALEQVRTVLMSRQRGWGVWSDWARMMKVEGTEGAEPALAPLRREAARVLGHPDLWEDLERMVELAFEAAARTLSTYSREKSRRRVVDYEDLVERALALALRADLAPLLSERFRLVVVDEFQDTTPLQLALFIRLHAITGRSVWVGDAKQCIFGFAGADPALMDAVLTWHRDAGGATDQLARNHRSRPPLVRLVNEVFGGAFEACGVDASLVHVEPTRGDAASGAPALGVWFTAPPNDQEARGIADGVARLLRTHAPQDIAVLVRSNAEAARIAGTLADLGIPVELARTGLTRTPEATLLVAALDWLLDRDRGARLILDALLGGLDDAALGAWIAREWRREPPDASSTAAPKPAKSALLRARRAVSSGRVGTNEIARIDDLRGRLAVLAPSEVVDELLHRLDAANLARRWPDPGQRLANLQALRTLATNFEAESGERGDAPTLRSFREWLRDVGASHGDADGGDQAQRTANPAVTVSTVHRSKGLEWPVVVLASLNDPPREGPFSVAAEARADGAFDPEDPLLGRWIRAWPWPFGALSCDPLLARARDSDAGRRVSERERRDRLRLLYVGFTRARDHLVLVVRDGRRRETAWLDELVDAGGRPLLLLPEKPKRDGPLVLTARDGRGGEHPHLAEVWLLADPVSTPATSAQTPWTFERAPSRHRPAYSIAPSGLARARTDAAGETTPGVELPTLVAGPCVRIHAGLRGAFVGAERVRVGDALHAFLAADDDALDGQTRLELARRVATTHGFAAAAPADLVRAADSLYEFARARWGPALWRREVPIELVLDPLRPTEQTVRGVIDLLLETPEGDVILDHKTAELTEPRWPEAAALFGPQLALYAFALQRMGRTVRALAVHLVLAGGVVLLEPPARTEPST